MALSTQPYKGTRDFYPEDMRVRKWIFRKWSEVCEQFGYEEYDGPILEPFELYASKTSEEIVTEQTYTLIDRGDRKVVMRPEMTPTVSRMVAAKRQELAYPVRLYSIPNCFRYERPQKGRLREFWQLNADIFGIEGVEADVEIIMLADATMQAFGANRDMYRIEIGSRNLLNEVASKYGVTDAQAFIRLVDAKDKMSKEEFERKLSDLVSGKENLELVIYILNLKSLEGLRTGLNLSSLESVREVLLALSKMLIDGPKTNIVFNPAVARGFDYYTDIVFEVFDTNPENNRSMFGGGRYDGLVGSFGVEPVPTVGFAAGDATLLNFLTSNNLLPALTTETDIYIATVGDVVAQAQDVAQKLRAAGLNVAVNLSDKKLDKQIKVADKKGITKVLFIGEKELEDNAYTLKDLKTGTSQTYSLEQLVTALKA